MTQTIVVLFVVLIAVCLGTELWVGTNGITTNIAGRKGSTVVYVIDAGQLYEIDYEAETADNVLDLVTVLSWSVAPNAQFLVTTSIGSDGVFYFTGNLYKATSVTDFWIAFSYDPDTGSADILRESLAVNDDSGSFAMFTHAVDDTAGVAYYFVSNIDGTTEFFGANSTSEFDSVVNLPEDDFLFHTTSIAVIESTSTAYFGRIQNSTHNLVGTNGMDISLDAEHSNFAYYGVSKDESRLLVSYVSGGGVSLVDVSSSGSPIEYFFDYNMKRLNDGTFDEENGYYYALRPFGMLKIDTDSMEEEINSQVCTLIELLRPANKVVCVQPTDGFAICDPDDWQNCVEFSSSNFARFIGVDEARGLIVYQVFGLTTRVVHFEDIFTPLNTVKYTGAVYYYSNPDGLPQKGFVDEDVGMTLYFAINGDSRVTMQSWKYECEAGEHGAFCEGICSECLGVCTEGIVGGCACSGNYGGINCDRCADGWDGPTCDICDVGYYGENCEPCMCVNGDCDEGIDGTGDCDCDVGSSGDLCDYCDDGYFGELCISCNCEHGTCADGNNGTGLCTCEGNWRGASCGLCKSGFFGSNCDACTCVNGVCRDGRNGNGMCSSCTTGWFGNNCNLDYEPTTEEEDTDSATDTKTSTSSSIVLVLLSFILSLMV